MTLPNKNAPGVLKMSVYVKHARLLYVQVVQCIGNTGFYYSPIEPKIYDSLQEFDKCVQEQIENIFEAKDENIEFDISVGEAVRYVVDGEGFGE